MGSSPGAPYAPRRVRRQTVSPLRLGAARSSRTPVSRLARLERVAGIEPARSAWEADRLPLHHTRPGALRPPMWIFGQPKSTATRLNDSAAGHRHQPLDRRRCRRDVEAVALRLAG